MLVVCAPHTHAPSASASTLDFIANFATGELQIVNTGATAVNLTAYSIDSDADALLPNGWLSIADNYDASDDQTVDMNDEWIVLLSTVSSLLEVEDDGDGGIIAPGQVVQLGALWDPTVAQDLEIEYLDGVQQVFVTPDYRSYDADFNEDLKVDQADLALWEAGFGTTSGAQLIDGDADRDGDVDALDFYLWADQVGSVSPFLPLLTPTLVAAGVPEPSAILLMGTAAALMTSSRRRRSSTNLLESGPR